MLTVKRLALQGQGASRFVSMEDSPPGLGTAAVMMYVPSHRVYSLGSLCLLMSFGKDTSQIRLEPTLMLS